MEISLQCIYTYDKREQDMINYVKVPEIAMKNKENLVAFMTTPLTNEEQSDLVKISACVNMDEKPPEWYMKRNGKFYFYNNKLQ